MTLESREAIAEHYDLYNPNQSSDELIKKIINDVIWGRYERIKYLFEENHLYGNEFLYFLLAARHGHTKILRLYMFHGADLAGLVDQKDGYGDTPLVAALKNKKWEAVSFLVKSKANPNICSSDRNLSPLHYAVKAEEAGLVSDLLQAGANVDAQCEDGFAPLHYAAVSGDELIAKLLIEFKANPAILNRHQKSPLEIVRKENYDSWKKFFPNPIRISLEPNSFYLDRSRNHNLKPITNPKREFSTLSTPASIYPLRTNLHGFWKPKPSATSSLINAGNLTNFIRRIVHR